MKCVVLGAGNVAWSLAPALAAAGLDVVQVWGRNAEKASALASTIDGCNAVSNPEDIIKDADLYVMAVHDDAIAPLAATLGRREGIWVHTSGSVDADALSPITDTFGVLYPLQTFSYGRHTSLSDVPVYVEGSDSATGLQIESIARAISSDVRLSDSARRRRVHAAAVFACNFANHLWDTADNLLRQSGDDLSVLYPLLRETTEKALSMPPHDAQTGPARRGDTRVMQAHLSALSREDSEVYKLLSNRIMKSFGHECDKL